MTEKNYLKNYIIDMQHVKIRLGGTWIHKDICLGVKPSEILGIVGGSGSGKTTILREMLALTQPTGGSIRIFNQEITKLPRAKLLNIQKRCGVLFQQNALFSSLNLLKNVAFPLYEHTALDEESINELALLKILMSGLPKESANKFPAELSGGMQKRAGLARAIVLDPELLFLDEPTAGLDPVTAAKFDQLILDLQNTMGLTIVMVTHDLDTLWAITDRIAFLGEGVVLGIGTAAELSEHAHPEIQAFFNGPRGRAAQDKHQSRGNQ
jgi:phospholipid/cholesterol/gamma-HCH transport system ATP-binding protein